jgi:hypothetical protein
METAAISALLRYAHQFTERSNAHEKTTHVSQAGSAYFADTRTASAVCLRSYRNDGLP